MKAHIHVKVRISLLAAALLANGFRSTGAQATTPAGQTGQTGQAGQGLWLNYDFVPGDRVIFADDFSGDQVGDFPRRLRLVEGNMEVVHVDGQSMLHTVHGGTFVVPLPQKLPKRFTIELRYRNRSDGTPLTIATSTDVTGREATFGCFSNKAFVEGNGVGPSSGDTFQSDQVTDWVDCRFTVDNGQGIKAYVNEHRTANAPQDSVIRTDSLIITLPFVDNPDSDHVFLASIRVAEGGKKLYDVLSEKGRVATQGILFDTGSDIVRPESTPTLKEIADMLGQHPDLKLTIEGHTDNVGVAAANQTLSEKRAAAVKQVLVSTFHVDPTRLTSKGFGSTKPAAPNTTPEGRQQNRRVELVKG